jgi:uncharacterized repeat protein (TIGR02543 family)
VFFSAEGGKGMSFTSKKVALNRTYGLLPEPYRVGYQFDGWWDARSGGNPISPFSWREEGDPTTLYAHWYADPRQVQIEVAKWNIKSKVTVSYDLKKMAAQSLLWTSHEKRPHYKKRWGLYVLNHWDGRGYADEQHVKIGTATLAKSSPANIVIPMSTLNYRPSSMNLTYLERAWMVCFKGKKTADVYSVFEMKVMNPGKVVSIDGRSVQLAKPRSFKRGKSYSAVRPATIRFLNPISRELLKERELTGGYVTIGDRLPRADPATSWWSVYYNNGRVNKSLDVWAPPLYKEVKIQVKNKVQRLKAKTDKKNPIYRAAKKLIGTHSDSCGSTARKALDKSGVNKGGMGFLFNLPLGAAKTGDRINEPDHYSIYIGNGKTINGSVTTHKTFYGKAPLRDAFDLTRPCSNLFRK